MAVTRIRPEEKTNITSTFDFSVHTQDTGKAMSFMRDVYDIDGFKGRLSVHNGSVHLHWTVSSWIDIQELVRFLDAVAEGVVRTDDAA